MKCMHRKYSGYDFLDKCKFNKTGLLTSVHSYFDYTDINNSDSDNDDTNDNNKDKDKDKDDMNKVLNELKYNIIENLKRLH